MAKNNLFLMFLIGLFVISFASAVTVNYAGYASVIQDDGSISETSTKVYNYNAVGYSCNNAGCTNLGNELFSKYTALNSYQVALVFPRYMMTQHGYFVFFNHPDYIDYEKSGLKVSGCATCNGGKIYFAKKASGYAPITNFVVTKDNVDIQVDFDVEVDTQTYNTIIDESGHRVAHDENVKTIVDLAILDSNGNSIYQDSNTYYIDDSNVRSVNYNYTFDSVGNYTIKVSTNVPDVKILSSIEQTKEYVINIDNSDLGDYDYSYTLLDNLEIENSNPRANETINFNIDYSSRYVNDSGDISPVGTSLYLYWYYNGALFQPAQHVVVGSDGNYDFEHVFPESGPWRVVVAGTPDPALGDEQIGDSEYVSFYVNVVYTPNNNNWTYTVNVTNIDYEDNISLGDEFNSTFDYNITGQDNIGNTTDIDGRLIIDSYVNDTFLFSENHTLHGNGTFVYTHNFTQIGNYSIDFELCPIINNSVVGLCEEWTINFSITDGNTPDNPDDDDDDNEDHRSRPATDYNETMILTVDSGLNVSNSTEITLGEHFGEKEKPQSLWWIIFLLIACILMLVAILLVYWE